MTAGLPTSNGEANQRQEPCISIRVNGEDCRLAAGTVLAAFLTERNVPAKFVAVAVNSEVVPRAEHRQVILHDGDVVEIVRMVGGGSGGQSIAHSAPAAGPVRPNWSVYNETPRIDLQKVKARCP